jgi:hypothetical protein
MFIRRCYWFLKAGKRERERKREREKVLLITGDERREGGREGGREGSGELYRSSNSSSSFIINCGYLQMQSS